MPIATADALTGLGFPGQQANALGANPHALTCTGTAQGTAAILKSRNTELVTAGGATGAIAPANAPVMEAYFIVNPTATSGVVYVPSGHSLNGSANAGVTVAQNKQVIFYQYKRGQWTYNLTA